MNKFESQSSTIPLVETNAENSIVIEQNVNPSKEEIYDILLAFDEQYAERFEED